MGDSGVFDVNKYLSDPNIAIHVVIIVSAVLVVASYLFGLLAKKTSIPSVLMLIGLGVVGRLLLNPDLKGITEILSLLGNVGLIMIVLEAALDLKLSADKKTMIWKSFIIALLGLVICAAVIAWLLQQFYAPLEFQVALLYATPFAIMSSAIIIPSVSSLVGDKKEFLIYEATFSDILGIMLFYFLVEYLGSGMSGDAIALSITGNIILTIIISVVVSYGLIFLLQRIDAADAKLFLLIAVLAGLYSVGKLFKISSLLIILVFGLILSNSRLFVFKRLRKHMSIPFLQEIFKDLQIITIESSFLLRTFFFITFGLSLNLMELVSSSVLLISLSFIVVIYVTRYLLFKSIVHKSIITQVAIAPRGLISILLFYSIPKDKYPISQFEEGILLYVILISSIFMAISLIHYQHTKEKPEEEVVQKVKPIAQKD